MDSHGQTSPVYQQPRHIGIRRNNERQRRTLPHGRRHGHLLNTSLQGRRETNDRRTGEDWNGCGVCRQQRGCADSSEMTLYRFTLHRFNN